MSARVTSIERPAAFFLVESDDDEPLLLPVPRPVEMVSEADAVLEAVADAPSEAVAEALVRVGSRAPHGWS